MDLDLLDTFPLSLVRDGLANFRRNILRFYYDLTLVHWIRIVAVIGAYMLLRPYLVRLGARAQEGEALKGNGEGTTDDRNSGSAAAVAE